MQEFFSTIHHIAVSEVILGWYVAAAILGAVVGRISRPGIPSRDAGALWIFGALLGLCLVAIVHLYPSFWAIVPTAVAVFCAFGLRADY